MRLRHRDPAAPQYEHLRRRPHQAGARGEVYVQADGARWGAFPDGLSYVEGRVAALLDGPDAHYLATPTQAVEAVELFAGTVGAAPGDVLVGRLDLASELRFPDGREGLTLLRAAASLDVPWLKTGTEGSKRDGLETVAWRNVRGRSKQLGLYDKGLESGNAPAGRWLRLERQTRRRKGRELVALELPEMDLRALYVGRELRSFVAEDVGVTVCDTLSAVELLNGLAEAGRITAGTADQLVGFLHRGRRAGQYPRATWYRRWASLRRLGIALDETQPEPVTVPVGRYLAQLAEAWAA